MPVLEGTKQNLLHLKCTPRNIKEFGKGRRTRQGQKRGTDAAQAERSDGRSSLSTIPALSFPPPAFCQGLVELRIKKVFPSACGRFSTMQHMVDNTVPLFILSLFHLPFLLGIQLLPVFPTQCPQHTNHITPRAPSDCVLTELKKLSTEESRLLHHHHGGPLNPGWGKSEGDSH